MVADILKVYIGNGGTTGVKLILREITREQVTPAPSEVRSIAADRLKKTYREDKDIPDQALRTEPGNGCCLLVSAKHYPDAG
jgi:hypothetical protein